MLNVYRKSCKHWIYYFHYVNLDSNVNELSMVNMLYGCELCSRYDD
jgi:hypothetical protein